MNLAARISDVAPDGRAWVPASVAGEPGSLSPDVMAAPAGTATLQGIGEIALAEVTRRSG